MYGRSCGGTVRCSVESICCSPCVLELSGWKRPGLVSGEASETTDEPSAFWNHTHCLIQLFSQLPLNLCWCFAVGQEYLDDSDGVDMTKFQERIWTNIKDIYKAPDDGLDSQQTPDQLLPDDTVPPPTQVRIQLSSYTLPWTSTHTSVTPPPAQVGRYLHNTHPAPKQVRWLATHTVHSGDMVSWSPLFSRFPFTCLPATQHRELSGQRSVETQYLQNSDAEYP